MAVAIPPSFAKVDELRVPELFISSRDNQFTASVRITNNSELPHTCQVVFRGYVRTTSGQFIYEFLHEQSWIILDHQGSSDHEVALDVWLPRFPPSITFGNRVVEYSCRATIDPWFANTHVEKTFKVERLLTLKMPHVSCFPKHVIVNECVGHGGWCHRKCRPVNGEIWTEKGAYTGGESILIRWRISFDTEVEEVEFLLRRITSFRNPDPGHPMTMDETIQEVFKGRKRIGKDDNFYEIKVPEHAPISIAMCIWNVMTVNYDVMMKVKAKGERKTIDFRFPMVIATEGIQGRARPKNPKELKGLHKRTQDVDDDSADDDDTDSETEGVVLEEIGREREYSLDVTRLGVITHKDGNLGGAYAEIEVVINSQTPRPLRSLRLMFVGECRAGSVWYEFVRYKALLSSEGGSAFSPGPHIFKVPLPFDENQYDTAILPPTLYDDVKYECRVTTDSWKANLVQQIHEVFVDRFVETRIKEEFLGPHSEQIGRFGVHLRQRVFQRGKFAFAKVTGDIQSCRLQIVQHRRLRQPGLKMDGSYCYERVVAEHDSGTDRRTWPVEFFVHIPNRVPPNIEVSYWNVLVLSYSLIVIPKGQDGHEHYHAIPIWIGCTDDELAPPEKSFVPEEEAVDVLPPEDDLPEFEVIRPEETWLQPWWVQRLNNDTYYEQYE